MIWVYTLVSVIIVSLISLIGILVFFEDENKIRPLLLVMVSFSAGALLGDAFIHLLPEATKETGEFGVTTSVALLSGVLVFFILEKFVHWHHCHLPHEHKHTKPVAVMSLVGDGMHNFIDGAVIAGSYLVNIPLGVTTTIAVILHEIPQEIGDFGILMYSGMRKLKALMWNFISATTAIIGAIAVLIFASNTNLGFAFLIPFTAGGFIYIAGVDLIPEIHREVSPCRSLIQFLSFVGGISIMFALLLLE